MKRSAVAWLLSGFATIACLPGTAQAQANGSPSASAPADDGVIVVTAERRVENR